MTGGSAATTASAADADFPALYKVQSTVCAVIAAACRLQPAACNTSVSVFSNAVQLEDKTMKHWRRPNLWCFPRRPCFRSQPQPRCKQESQLARENTEKAAQLAKELPLQHEPLSQSSRYATGMLLQVSQTLMFP